MSVTVSFSVSVTVSVSSFYMSHKLLHHEEGDNSTEDPQPHRQDGALAWKWRHWSVKNEANSDCSQAEEAERHSLPSVPYTHLPLTTVGVSVSRLLQSVVRMRFQSVRNEVQEGVTQEPPGSKAE